SDQARRTRRRVRRLARTRASDRGPCFRQSAKGNKIPAEGLESFMSFSPSKLCVARRDNSQQVGTNAVPAEDYTSASAIHLHAGIAASRACQRKFKCSKAKPRRIRLCSPTQLMPLPLTNTRRPVGASKVRWC